MGGFAHNLDDKNNEIKRIINDGGNYVLTTKSFIIKKSK